MNQHPFELWLIWQNSKTRQRYHAGNLIHENGVYKYYYEKGYRRKLEDAIKNGYTPLLSFPDTDKVYTLIKLFPPFSRRVPDTRRSDFGNLFCEPTFIGF